MQKSLRKTRICLVKSFANKLLILNNFRLKHGNFVANRSRQENITINETTRIQKKMNLSCKQFICRLLNILLNFFWSDLFSTTSYSKYIVQLEFLSFSHSLFSRLLSLLCTRYDHFIKVSCQRNHFFRKIESRDISRQIIKMYCSGALRKKDIGETFMTRRRSRFTLKNRNL